RFPTARGPHPLSGPHRPGRRFCYETLRFTTKFARRTARDFLSNDFSLAHQYSTAAQPIMLSCNPRLMARGDSGSYDTGNFSATWVDVAMGHFDRTLSYISDLQKADTPGAVAEKLLGVTSAFGLTAL